MGLGCLLIHTSVYLKLFQCYLINFFGTKQRETLTRDSNGLNNVFFYNSYNRKIIHNELTLFRKGCRYCPNYFL